MSDHDLKRIEKLVWEILDEQRAIYHLLQVSVRFEQRIVNLLTPHSTTTAIANVFSGESPMANNALVFNVGQTSRLTPSPHSPMALRLLVAHSATSL